MLPRVLDVRLDLSPVQEKLMRLAFMEGLQWGLLAGTLAVLLAVVLLQRRRPPC